MSIEDQIDQTNHAFRIYNDVEKIEKYETPIRITQNPPNWPNSRAIACLWNDLLEQQNCDGTQNPWPSHRHRHRQSSDNIAAIIMANSVFRQAEIPTSFFSNELLLCQLFISNDCTNVVKKFINIVNLFDDWMQQHSIPDGGGMPYSREAIMYIY